MSHRLRAAARPPPSGSWLARVLVVEDERDHREAMCDILTKEGYRVEAAVDGSAALDRLDRGAPPDVLVVDLTLPGMDGWQLIAALRERPQLARIPVIVMSSGGSRTLMAAPVSAGYLEKPVDPARLLETLAACTARRRRRSSGSRPASG